MTFNVRTNSPLFHKRIQGNLEGESSNLSEVTEGFFPGTPSIEIAPGKLKFVTETGFHMRNLDVYCVYCRF